MPSAIERKNWSADRTWLWSTSICCLSPNTFLVSFDFSRSRERTRERGSPLYKSLLWIRGEVEFANLSSEHVLCLLFVVLFASASHNRQSSISLRISPSFWKTNLYESSLVITTNKKHLHLLNHRIQSLGWFAVLVSLFVWGITQTLTGMISGPVFFSSCQVDGVITITFRKRSLVFFGPFELCFVSPLHRDVVRIIIIIRKNETEEHKFKNPGCRCWVFLYTCVVDDV